MSLRQRRIAVIAWFALLAAAIVAPWWMHPGYVWLLDSVWGPHQAISWAHPTANLPWQIVAHLLVATVTAPIAEKLVLTGVLWSIGLSGYYLARRLVGPGWAWSAGTLYLLNPFVYERLLAGQWIVLAGYALLPVALALAYDALESRGRRHAYWLAAVIIGYPFVSPHFAYINIFLLLGLAIIFAVTVRPAWLLSQRTIWWTGGLLVAGLCFNWFWLASPTGRAYQAFGVIDFATFRTAADPVVGVWGNVLGLYGFWRGPAFIEPKAWLGPVWIAIAIVILVLAAAGAVRAVRARQPLGLTLAAAAPVALILAVGYASPLSRPVTLTLIHSLPGFRGLRDSGKLVAVLALSYAMLAPYAAAMLASRLNLPRRPARWAPIALAVLAAVSVTGLIPGAAGQVTVADYPPGWTTVAGRLSHNPRAAVVILPWHNYLSLNFAQNTYAAQPAPVFFSNPIISSDEIDNILAARPDTPADRAVLAATAGRITPRQWAAKLRGLGARYVVLEKTDDWAGYQPLINAAGLTSVYQDPTIALYRL